MASSPVLDPQNLVGCYFPPLKLANLEFASKCGHNWRLWSLSAFDAGHLNAHILVMKESCGSNERRPQSLAHRCNCLFFFPTNINLDDLGISRACKPVPNFRNPILGFVIAPDALSAPNAPLSRWLTPDSQDCLTYYSVLRRRQIHSFFSASHGTTHIRVLVAVFPPQYFLD